jgi:hypothetical protein
MFLRTKPPLKLQLRHKKPILRATTEPQVALSRSSRKSTTPTELSPSTHYQSRRCRNLVKHFLNLYQSLETKPAMNARTSPNPAP